MVFRENVVDKKAVEVDKSVVVLGEASVVTLGSTSFFFKLKCIITKIITAKDIISIQ